MRRRLTAKRAQGCRRCLFFSALAWTASRNSCTLRLGTSSSFSEKKNFDKRNCINDELVGVFVRYGVL